MKFSAISVAAALASMVSAADVPTIDIVGSKFFYSNNGSQFYIRGVAYQQDSANETAKETFSDPLSDGDACKRDLPYLLQLKTNVLRVYAIDTTKDHDTCMNLFNDAGIYVISDLSQPGESINRNSPSWDVDLYQRYTSVVDTMQKYPNMLGFFAGNEVTNNNTNTDASPYVKAAIRDMKSYMKSKSYRSIPVGYATNDDEKTRDNLATYFQCGNASDAADFYGINIYEWCGDATFESSGYEQRTEEYKNFTIPIFFSEYGCNRVKPRQFSDVPALFGPNMTDVWSGGIVYMYFEEQNQYGLVSVSGSSVSTLPDFNNLSSQMAKISPSSINSKDYKPSQTVGGVSCPDFNANWKGSPTLPPTPKIGTCQCINDGSSCVVNSDTNAKNYGDLFGELCGNLQVDCSEINSNGTSGTYGDLSFCDAKQKLNFLMGKYYNSQNGNSQACDFSSQASIVQNPKTGSNCQNAQATAVSSGGSSGSGGAAASGSSGSSGSSARGSAAAASGSAAASSSKGGNKKSAAASLTAEKVIASVVLGSIAIMAVIV